MLQVAVIGCGNFARRQHLPIIASSPRMRLHAVCDIDRDVVESCAGRFGAGRSHTDARAVFEDPEVDAVVIAVRDELQARLAWEAVRSGKHVYVEKPCAETDADFQDIIEARDRSGVHVAVGFNKRFSPAYQCAVNLISARGGARQIYLRMADDAWRWAHGYAPGSLLRHDVCHLFDLACWLSQSPVSSVYSQSARDDDDAVLMEHANGSISLVMNSGHATIDFPKERMEAICGRGSVIMEDFVEVRCFGSGGGCFTFPGMARSSGDEPYVEMLGRRGMAGMLEVRAAIAREWNDSGSAAPRCLPNFIRDQGWKQSMESFAEVLARGGPLPHATLEDARSAARIVDAAVRSRRSRLPVTIAES